MTVEYKAIFRADKEIADGLAPEWEQGCPVQLAAIQVSRSTETAEAYLQIKVHNISCSDVESISGEANISYTDGTSSTIEFEDLDADIKAGGQGVLRPVALPKGNVDFAAVKLIKVRLEDKRWKSSGPAGNIPARRPIALNPRAMAERIRKLSAAGASEETFGFAVQDNDEWWVCACGQVNTGRITCCTCGAPKDLLQENEDEAELLKSADEWSEQTYQEGIRLASGKNNVRALKDATRLFLQIENWKDAAAQAKMCEAKIREASKRRKKRIATTTALIIVLIIVTAISLTAQTFLREQERAKIYSEFSAAITSVQPGDIVKFGSYEQDANTLTTIEPIEWRVLANTGYRVLLISEYTLDVQPYNHYEPYDGYDWEKSFLKNWLEHDFKYAAFSEDERAVIESGPFCLNCDEAYEYFSSDDDRTCKPTAYALSQMELPPKHIESSGNSDWWLGSTNILKKSEAFLVDYTGKIYSGNPDKREYVAVRPAIWVTLYGSHLVGK